jgi:hypothetical protein
MSSDTFARAPEFARAPFMFLEPVTQVTKHPARFRTLRHHKENWSYPVGPVSAVIGGYQAVTNRLQAPPVASVARLSLALAPAWSHSGMTAAELKRLRRLTPAAHGLVAAPVALFDGEVVQVMRRRPRATEPRPTRPLQSRLLSRRTRIGK